jgi:hypothetical protein
MLVRGGRVIDPGGGRDEVADLLIVDGRVDRLDGVPGCEVFPHGDDDAVRDEQVGDPVAPRGRVDDPPSADQKPAPGAHAAPRTASAAAPRWAPETR